MKKRIRIHEFISLEKLKILCSYGGLLKMRKGRSLIFCVLKIKLLNSLGQINTMVNKILVFLFIVSSILLIKGQGIQLSTYEKFADSLETYSKGDERALPFIQHFIEQSKHQFRWGEISNAFMEAVYYSKRVGLKHQYADSSIVYALKSHDPTIIARSYMGKGIIYFYNQQDYRLALQHYLTAKPYAEQSKDQYLHYKLVYHIGIVKSYLGYHEDAQRHFLNSLQFFESELKKAQHPNAIYNAKKGYLNSLHRYIIEKQKDGDLKESSVLISRGLGKTSSKSNFALEYYYFLKSKGVQAFLEKRYHDALEYLNPSFAYFKEHDDEGWLLLSQYYIGKSLVGLGQHGEAAVHFQKIVDVVLQKPFYFEDLEFVFDWLERYYHEHQDEKASISLENSRRTLARIEHQSFKELSRQLHQQYDQPQYISENKILFEKLYQYKVLLISIVALLVVLGIYSIIKHRKKILLKVKKRLVLRRREDQIKQNSNTPVSTLPLHFKEDILGKLVKFEETEGYLNPKLTITILAKKLGTNNHYLSQIINEHFELHFNQYINRLRVEYLIRILDANPKYKQYHLEALAHECGFTSRERLSKSFLHFKGIKISDYLEGLRKH